jgi:RNA polymerase sigma-70 factor (ECF subfamily)
MTAAATTRPMTDFDGTSPDPADLAALRAREPVAVAAFIRRHEPAVRRLAARITAWSDDVPDLVQDVLTAAIVALPAFRGESGIETWLLRIAINRCRRHIRRRRLIRLFHAARAQLPAPASPHPVDQAETNAAVRRAVASLPQKYREVIVLRYLEERTTKQTADILGERVNTVDVRLHRARAMLESALRPLVTEKE